MATFIYPPEDVTVTGVATEATQLQVLTAVQAIEAAGYNPATDQLDTPLLDTSSTNIPGSASLPVQVVSSLAVDVFRLISVEDIGEFIGLYTGGVGVEQLLLVLSLGGGDATINIPAGTRISLRAMKTTAISSGFICINFIGN